MKILEKLTIITVNMQMHLTRYQALFEVVHRLIQLILQKPNEVNAIIVPILYMKELRHKDVKKLTQSHICKWSVKAF